MRDIRGRGRSNIDESQRRFVVIDPVDGTADWLRGLDIFGSAVSLIEDGKTIFSVIFLPTKEITEQGGLYFAAEGEGAWRLRGSEPVRLRVSSTPVLSEATMLFEGSSKKLASLPVISRFKQRIARSREIMCSTYCTALTASGSAWPQAIDGWISYNNAVWDDAPGMLFIPESGGAVSDWEGNSPITTGRANHVFSNGILHAQILAALRECA